MKANSGVIILVFVAFIGVLLAISLSAVMVPHENEIPIIEEQESIQKEGVERMDTLQFDSYRNIGVFRDNKRNVTCWIDLNRGGISCIPGHMLTP
jgi:hypothetical protein